MRTAILVSFAGLLTACTASIPEGRFRCDDDSDCPGAFVCHPTTSRCVSSIEDLGVVDVGGDGGVDLSIPEGGVDLNMPDTGVDLGMPDTGVVCAGACAANASCLDQGTGPTCVCNVGYTGNGTTCTIVNCGAPPTIGNGTVSATSTTYGSSGTLMCQSGFAPAGTSVGSCQVDGTWSAFGTCEDVNECQAGNPCTAGGQTLAVCTNIVGAYTCECGVGYTFANGTCTRTNVCTPGYGYDSLGACVPTSCNAVADPDSASVIVPIGRLFVAGGGIGSNLDGIRNESASGGRTIDGCGQLDGSGGVDASFSSLVSALSAIVDVSGAMEDLNMATYVRLTHVSSMSATDDPCVGVEIVAPGRGTIGSGSGSLVGRTLLAHLPGAIDLPIMHEGPFTGSCSGTAGACASGLWTVRVTNSRLAIPRDVNGLIAGAGRWDGTMFNQDCTQGTIDSFGICGGASVPFASMNPTGLAEGFVSFAGAIGLDDAATTQFRNALLSAEDLHMEADATISLCGGSSFNENNRNAVSFSLALTP